LGIFAALVLVAPIRASHRMIEKWLLKQRNLFKTGKELSALAFDRDTINGIDIDISRDKDHNKNLLSSNYAPWVFLIFWILAVAWGDDSGLHRIMSRLIVDQALILPNFGIISVRDIIAPIYCG
jgi:hypothetical protein